MAKNYVLSTTNGSLPLMGSNFSKKLVSSETASSISFTLAAKDPSDRDYGLTDSTTVNIAHWATGDITVYVVIDTGSSNTKLSIKVRRLSSMGIEQEATSISSAKSASAGTLTFNFTSISWTAGNIADRLVVDFLWDNSLNSSDTPMKINTGNSQTRIETAIDGRRIFIT